MPSPPALVVLAFAAYRLARFVAADTLTLPFRDGLYDFAYDADRPTTYGVDEPAPSPRAAWRTHLYDLMTCQWCLGTWWSALLYVAWRYGGGTVRVIIAVVAVAGVQGFLVSRGDQS